MSDYSRSLDWVYSFVNLEARRTPALARDSMRLAKIAHLLARLGHPERGADIAHIAGSKGKGSVAFLLDRCLASRGVRTGLYTSPHLFDARERIRVDGEPIPESGFLELAGEIRAIVEATPGEALKPTFFDIFTAMAFAWFRRRRARFWVVETGLGGRLDSTNVVAPRLAIISSISKEHTEILGRRLRDIAREKAGIIKPAVPVVAAGNRAEVAAVLRQTARERQAPLYLLPEHSAFRSAGYRREPDGRILQKMVIDGRALETSLLGLYQVENIALFLLALRVLRQELGGALPVDPGGPLDFLRGLEWPGRLTHRRLDGVELWVDGAHNAESARYLRRTLQALRASGVIEPHPVAGIVGMFQEKDHAGILKAILPLLDFVYFIEPDPWRDCRPEHYLPVFHRLNARGIPHRVLGPVYREEGWLARLAEECAVRFPGGCSLLATGSLYTASLVLRALQPGL